MRLLRHLFLCAGLVFLLLKVSRALNWKASVAVVVILVVMALCLRNFLRAPRARILVASSLSSVSSRLDDDGDGLATTWTGLQRTPALPGWTGCAGSGPPDARFPPLPAPQVQVFPPPQVQATGMPYVCLGTTNNQVGLLDDSRKKRGGEKKAREKKEDARVRTEVNTTNAVGTHCATRGLEADSEDEGKGSKGRLRAPHVPGSLGLHPPSGSALGKKLALVAPVRPDRKGELKSGAPRARGAQGQEVTRERAFFVPFMDICRVDTPMLKRVPNAQRSNFATQWGRLLQAAVDSRQEAAWSEFFVFPKCVLWSPARGGGRLAKKASVADLVKARMVQWSTGDREQLWKDAVRRSRKPLVEEPKKERSDKERLEVRVLAALRMGDVRKALQMLNSAPIAPKTKETLDRMRKLHPQGANPEPGSRGLPRFTVDVVRSALGTFGPSSAAGLFGYKPFLLQQCVRAESFHFSGALTSAVNDFAAGRAPSYLKRFIAGGVSIALEKSATAVRPLACGDPLRRLVAKCFCVAGKEEISAAFKGKNFGVGCPGGVEVVAHSLRDVLQKHSRSKLGLLKIDFRNAFNEIKRDHFVKAVDSMFPAMSNWTQWCYGEATMLLYDHEHIIESCAGVQQGDPLGPLYFCCGINGLVNEIAALNPVYNKWYMDDGGIVGDVELLRKVWEVLKTRGPALGLHLNPSKCEWSWLDAGSVLPCPIRLEGVSEENQVKLVPHSEIQMLGVPLGGDEFVSGFVRSKLLGRLSETVGKLVGFEDTQAATYLLRVSYSVVRAVHFMRTTPLAQWRKEGEEFDEMVCDAAGRILGHPFDTRTFAQAALTPKLGGLGLRKSVEHADFAFSASWHESRVESRETWSRPAQVSEAHVRQSVASYDFDEKMHKYLVDSAPDEREKQRLLRVARPHAGSYITAVPSEEDGQDCLMRPRLFRIAVSYRLGFPVLANEIPCALCMQPINVYGDHATCCAKNGDLVTRHNAMRNLVYSIASDGLLKPALEKQGILGPTTGRRPGDVSVPDWKHGMGLAIDVAVTSPLTKGGVRVVSPCEDYAAVQKHRKYDASFEGMNYYFCAMVFETFGAINDQGEDVMRQLFTFAAQHLGREFSSFCSRGWARVSCCLQRSVAQMIANRIDGQVGAPEPASESFVVSGGGLDVAFEQLEEGKGGERNGGGEPMGTGPLVGSVVRLTPTPVALAPAPLAPAPLAPTPVAPALLTPARVAAAPTTPAPLALARLASPLASPSRFPASSVGGVNPLRGDGFCGLLLRSSNGRSHAESSRSRCWLRLFS